MSKRKPRSARELALRALRSLERTGGFSNRVLSDELERALDLDGRDRAFATTLFYGVLRHRTRLDAAIDGCAHEPRKLKGELREILRIAAFELLELQHPLRVAGSESILLSRNIDPAGRLKGVVTAILGGIDRDGRARDAELLAGDPIDIMVRLFSIPRWLSERWVTGLGAERALLRARALAVAPALDLRVDVSRMKVAEAALALESERPEGRIELLPQEGALRAHGGGDLFHGPLHERGFVSVQSLGSQRAAILLDPSPGERILDACCGMGTKTLQIAERMQRRGSIVAVDDDRERMSRLHEMRERGELDRPELEVKEVCGDLRDATLDLGLPFAAILLDAPCSGLGNLARHPELRWRCQPADLERHALLQHELLAACLARLTPGGRLVYAVCSLEPEEGPELVRRITDPQVRIVHEEQITPEEQQSDGFYVALLRLAE